MILVKYLRDFIFFIPIVFIGWLNVLIYFLFYLYSIWLKKTIILKISLIFYLLQFIFATRPWFEYKIQFNDVHEILSVSSKINLIFIFMSLVNCILLLTEFSFSAYIIPALQLIMGILFLFGYQDPSSIHVDFLKSSDYSFNYNFYAFLAFYIPAFFISIGLFFKKKKEN